MSTDTKIDLFKLHKAEYVTPKAPVLVKVRKARYLAIEGSGSPGGESFQTTIGALYGMAFTIKMTRKFAGLEDYVVGKLEAQYWAPGERALDEVAPEKWQWRMLIRTPECVKRRDLKEAAEKLIARGNGPAVHDVGLASFAMGNCIQMLHVGPYEKEGETVAKMREMMAVEGWRQKGPHHEVYLSDPRRVAPEKLRTILRIPVRRS